MKVLVLTQSFIRYKSDITSAYLFSLSKEIQTIGVDISVLAPHESSLPLYEKIDGIGIYRFRYAPCKFEGLAYRGNMHELVMRSFVNKIIFAMYLVYGTIKAIEVIRKEKINIIHAHWWVPSGIIALLVSRITGKPYIVTSHGTDVFMMRKLKILVPLAKMVFKKAKFITVVSNEMKSFLINDIVVPANKIEVFPMPCDFSLFYPIDESEGSHLPVREEKIILNIGRLIKWKGHNYLIKAIEFLKKKKHNVKLIIIGNGPEEMELKRQVKELNLEDCIEIIPFRPKNELNYFYNLCDVFVLPSITDSLGLTEGLGLVSLEAMSCKKPVIGTNTGGIKDIIKDGETGLLVPEKDPQALADAIEKLLENKELVNKLAERGYNFVKNNFTVSKIAGKMVEVYKNV